MRGRCSTPSWPETSTIACARRSWRRPGATRWRSWSCLGAGRRPNSRSGSVWRTPYRWRLIWSTASPNAWTRLPRPTRLFLLAAALEPTGDLSLLQRAIRQLDVDFAASAPAGQAGLIELGVRVRFRHPLARSAVARAAEVADLQTVAPRSRRGDRPGPRSRPAGVAPGARGERVLTRRSPSTWRAPQIGLGREAAWLRRRRFSSVPSN